MPIRSSVPLAALLCAGLALSVSCVRGSSTEAGEGEDAPIVKIADLTASGSSVKTVSDSRAQAVNSPVHWELSQEASLTYATLLLDQSIRNDSLAGVLEAADIFMRLNPAAQALTEAGAWLLFNKELDAARRVLEQAASKQPRELSLHLLLAETWLEGGDTAKALSIMEDFQRRWPESDQARQEVGILLLKSQRYADAHAMFRSLPVRLRSPYVRYCHARALIMLQRPDEAAVELAEAVRTSPDFLEAWSELARAYELSGQPAKARPIFNRLITSEPENFEYRLRALGLELAAKQPAKALDMARGGPDNPGFLLNAVSLFMDAAYYKEAETLLDGLLLSNDPPPDDVWLMRAGLAFEARHDVAEALSWLDRITPGSSVLNRAYRFRIQILFNSKDDAGVLDSLHKAQSLFPDDREFILMEAHFYITRNTADKALPLIEGAVQRAPEDIDLLFSYGTVLDSLQRKPEALDIMERILRLDPNFYQALNFVGYTIADKAAPTSTDLARALDLLHRAASLAPDKAYILDSLAWAQYKAGEFSQAWQTIRKAVALPNSNEADIWEHYGDIANALNNKVEARRGWKQALQFEPGAPEKLEKKIASE